MAFAAVLVSLNSCGTMSGPIIRGKYDPIKVATTDLGYEKVWEKVIDFFAEANIPIDVLDKSSGLISAKEIGFDNDRVTVEDKSGKIADADAWFVLPYAKNAVDGRAKCSFNIRVKSLDNGKTSIQINLSNITGYYDILWFNPSWLRKEILEQTYPRDCVSTGAFEAAMLDYLK